MPIYCPTAPSLSPNISCTILLVVFGLTVSSNRTLLLEVSSSSCSNLLPTLLLPWLLIISLMAAKSYEARLISGLKLICANPTFAGLRLKL